jgi:transposase
MTKAKGHISVGRQFELFDDLPIGPGKRCNRNQGPLKFNKPDPSDIYIGTQRLEVYLKEQGIKKPLLIREIMLEQTWEAFEVKYKSGGRPPYAPSGMMGIILYGIMNGVNSLRGLEELARLDVGCMWVSGGMTPDHAALGRFIMMHHEHIKGEFFETLTRTVLKRTASGVQEGAVDATVIQAAGSRYKLLRKEAAEMAAKEAKEKAQQNPDNEELAAIAQKAEKLQETLDERIEARRRKGKDVSNTSICSSEPEAVIQPLKNTLLAPSYKASAIANEKRVVTAIDVDPSNEIKVVANMLAQADRIGCGQLERLLADAGYFSNEMIELSISKNIDLLCPEGKSQDNEKPWNKKSAKIFLKSAFEYDSEQDLYRCPGKAELRPASTYKGNKKNPGYVLYRSPACKTCPLREKCNKNKSGRKIKRFVGDASKDVLRKIMEDKRARKAYKKRQAMIEPVFSVLKLRQGLTRFRRFGLLGAKVEFALHILAYNLSCAVNFVTGQGRFGRRSGSNSVQQLIFYSSLTLLWFDSDFLSAFCGTPSWFIDPNRDFDHFELITAA